MDPGSTNEPAITVGARSMSVIFGDRFYSVAELAEVTGYHRDSIYRAIESGSLVAAKPRGKWLIAGAAIDAWLQPANLATGGARALRVVASARAQRARTRHPETPGARPSFRELARRRKAT